MTFMELMLEYDQGCEGMLDATEQSVYVSLVLIWNRLRRPEWFRVSRTELMRKAGIKGQHRLERAQESLEQKGFIKTTKRAKTAKRMYRLEPLPTRAEIAQETRAKTAITRAEMAQEKETLEPKQPECMSQNGSKLELKQLTSQRETYTEIDNHLSVDVSSYKIQDPPEREIPKLPEDVLEHFYSFHPVPLKYELEALAVWTEEYGTRAVKAAIDKAKGAGASHINYVKMILFNNGGDNNNHGRRTKQPSRRLTAEEERAKWEAAIEKQRRFEARQRATLGEGWNL